VDPSKVLIVDDNLDLAHALELRLRANNYQAVLAQSGPSAVALALAHKPIAILLDLHLPKEDGLAVMMEFRSCPEIAGVPVIVMSADCSVVTQHKVLDAGAHAFLDKPLNHRSLLHMLRGIEMRSADQQRLMATDPHRLQD
jgi:DNA-binding response OmpR family regulator